MGAAEAIQVGVTFGWLGAVVAISLLETPLKFRAPGMTVELGVGVGRLVFRALNILEIVLALVLTGAAIAGARANIAILIALWIVLLLQAAVLRPLMDRRVKAEQTSPAMPKSRLHYGYIALELVKIVLLLVLGVRLLGGALS